MNVSTPLMSFFLIVSACCVGATSLDGNKMPFFFLVLQTGIAGICVQGLRTEAPRRGECMGREYQYPLQAD